MIKKLLCTILLLLFSFTTVFSQQEKGIFGVENWLDIWTDFSPGDNEYKSPTQILSGVIKKDTKLYKKDTYLLLGNVFVSDSATITIEPGTVILGDYKTNGTLTISNGSKIIADGTQTDPIIFSSSRKVKKKGDWGGIFILGDAPVNKIGTEWELGYGLNPTEKTSITYGGNDTENNSGIFKYVRIEYAGKRTKDFGYFSGLTLAGVGNETVLENVMVNYCQGSSFSVIGGNINLNKLVSFKARENDLMINYGAQVDISNSLIVKSPYFTKAGGSSSIHISSYNDITQVDSTKLGTHLEANNLTLLVLSNSLREDTKVGLVHEAIYVSTGATLKMQKTILSGYNPAVILDNKIKIDTNSLSNMDFNTMYFNNCIGNIFTEGQANNEDLENWYGNRILRNVYSKGSDKETFIETEDLENPDFRLRINKIIAITLPDED